MATRILEAIASRWDDESLGSTFTGGIWYGDVPADTAYPYVAVTGTGGAVDGFTSDSIMASYGVQFTIYYKADRTTDPVDSLGDLIRTFQGSFNESIKMSVTEGTVLHFVPTNDPFPDEVEEGVYAAGLEFEVVRRKPRN